MRPASILIVLATAAASHAATPRTAPTEYPAHADSRAATIGAEYLVHSIPTEQQMLLGGNYLVIEIGLFPKRGQDVTLSSGQFRLIVNGKPLRSADTPGSVAASLKYNDWEERRGLQTATQVGPVIIGPQQTGRFPGDPTSRPVPEPVPQDDPTGGMSAQPLSVDDLIARAALPEGVIDRPAGGCLFFHYDGKAKKVRTVELVWEPAGSEPITLKLK